MSNWLVARIVVCPGCYFQFGDEWTPRIRRQLAATRPSGGVLKFGGVLRGKYAGQYEVLLERGGARGGGGATFAGSCSRVRSPCRCTGVADKDGNGGDCRAGWCYVPLDACPDQIRRSIAYSNWYAGGSRVNALSYMACAQTAPPGHHHPGGPVMQIADSWDADSNAECDLPELVAGRYNFSVVVGHRVPLELAELADSGVDDSVVTEPFSESAAIRANYGRGLDSDDGLGAARFEEALPKAAGSEVYTLLVVPQVGSLSTAVSGSLGRHTLIVGGSGFDASPGCGHNLVALSGVDCEVVECSATELRCVVGAAPRPTTSAMPHPGTFGLRLSVYGPPSNLYDTVFRSQRWWGYNTLVYFGSPGPAMTSAFTNDLVGDPHLMLNERPTELQPGSGAHLPWIHRVEGYFVAPYTAWYTFMARGGGRYGRCVLRLGTNWTTQSLRTVATCTGTSTNGALWANDVACADPSCPGGSDGPSQVFLAAQQRYAVSYDYFLTDYYASPHRFPAAVRIHAPEIDPPFVKTDEETQYHSWNEVQGVLFTPNFHPEIDELKLTGLAGGFFEFVSSAPAQAGYVFQHQPGGWAHGRTNMLMEVRRSAPIEVRRCDSAEVLAGVLSDYNWWWYGHTGYTYHSRPCSDVAVTRHVNGSVEAGGSVTYRITSGCVPRAFGHLQFWQAALRSTRLVPASTRSRLARSTFADERRLEQLWTGSRCQADAIPLLCGSDGSGDTALTAGLSLPANYSDGDFVTWPARNVNAGTDLSQKCAPRSGFVSQDPIGRQCGEFTFEYFCTADTEVRFSLELEADYEFGVGARVELLLSYNGSASTEWMHWEINSPSQRFRWYTMPMRLPLQVMHFAQHRVTVRERFVGFPSSRWWDGSTQGSVRIRAIRIHSLDRCSFGRPEAGLSPDPKAPNPIYPPCYLGCYANTSLTVAGNLSASGLAVELDDCRREALAAGTDYFALTQPPADTPDVALCYVLAPSAVANLSMVKKRPNEQCEIESGDCNGHRRGAAGSFAVYKSSYCAPQIADTPSTDSKDDDSGLLEELDAQSGSGSSGEDSEGDEIVTVDKFWLTPSGNITPAVELELDTVLAPTIKAMHGSFRLSFDRVDWTRYLAVGAPLADVATAISQDLPTVREVVGVDSAGGLIQILLRGGISLNSGSLPE